MLKKNQEIELTCEALGAELEGVCRYEGQAVFVPGALPGEKLRGSIKKVRITGVDGELLTGEIID